MNPTVGPFSSLRHLKWSRGILASRYIDGWMVAEILPGKLTLHADRGASMRSKPVALLLADLGVTKTHSRLYTNGHNPDSEAHFNPLKSRPGCPQRCGNLPHAREERGKQGDFVALTCQRINQNCDQLKSIWLSF